MQELEKILEEIKNEAYNNPEIGRKQCEGMLRAMNIIRKHVNDGWISVEKYGLPKEEGIYDLTIINGRGEYVSVRWEFLSGVHLSGNQHYVDGVHYWADNYQGNPINDFLSERVIAWRKKPEPYRPEQPETCKYTGGSCCWPIDQCGECPNNQEMKDEERK